MFNFTEKIKNEIMANSFDTVDEKMAVFCGFLRTGGKVCLSDGLFGFELLTENDRIADFFESILSEQFKINGGWIAKSDILSGKDKFIFSCVDENTDKLLVSAEIVRKNGDKAEINQEIPDKIISDESLRSAFIQGAFLGGGSCTLPDEKSYSSTGYHLEVDFPDVVSAREFCDLLCEAEIFTKLVMRKESAVVYVKSKEVVSDILYILGANESMQKLYRLAELKDKVNNANRANNCSVSNIDRTLTASVNQVRAIEVISQTVGLKSLDAGLFEVAEARIADKNASMQELAERLGISKSCINHRMRKIIAMANELDD